MVPALFGALAPLEELVAREELLRGGEFLVELFLVPLELSVVYGVFEGLGALLLGVYHHSRHVEQLGLVNKLVVFFVVFVTLGLELLLNDGFLYVILKVFSLLCEIFFVFE